MNTKTSATAVIKCKPGKSAAMKTAILELIAETLKEPECEIFKVLQNDENPEEFVLWEIFGNPSARQAHMEKSYTKKYFALDLAESATVIHHTELAR